MPVKISRGNIRGVLEEDVFALLPEAFFKRPVSFALEIGAEVVKDSGPRWAGIASLSKGTRVFLKRDRNKGGFERVKFLFLPSRARQEWLVARRLREKGVDVPRPLGWLERRKRGLVTESYYLSEAVGSGFPLIDRPGGMDGKGCHAALARAVKKIHEAGLLHKDFHAGNFLWKGDSLLLTDLHGARVVRAVSMRKRLWMIAHLFHSLRTGWTEEDRQAFLQAYFQGEPLSPSERYESHQTIDAWMDRLQRIQWRSRTKRCMKQSTEFTMQRIRGVTYRRRRHFEFEQLKAALEEHRRVRAEAHSALLKAGTYVTVSGVWVGGRSICLKQFHRTSLPGRLKDFFRCPKARKAWVGGNGLRARGLSAPEPLALVEGRGESFFVMERLNDGEEMDRYLARGFPDWATKRRFIRAFAAWLSRLHDHRVHHRDMKTCNIWVRKEGEGWSYTLLDLEDVILEKRVGEKMIFKAFLQLNASTPGLMTRTDRLRFARHYLKAGSLTPRRKAWLGRIAEETRRRGIVYVGASGTVQEDVPLKKKGSPWS